MKLSEMVINQKIIVQFIWGGQTIEFTTAVIGKDGDGVAVMPHLYNGKPLEFNIDMNSGVQCNVFADDVVNNNSRVSWRNVSVVTENRDRGTVYLLKTNHFNELAREDERRKNERIVIRKNGQVYDQVSDKHTDVMVHDISDKGISFYAPQSFEPQSNQVTVSFSDIVDDKEFNIKVDCTISRIQNKMGTVFYGCSIPKENRDYLLYAFTKKLINKVHKE